MSWEVRLPRKFSVTPKIDSSSKQWLRAHLLKQEFSPKMEAVFGFKENLADGLHARRLLQLFNQTPYRLAWNSFPSHCMHCMHCIHCIHCIHCMHCMHCIHCMHCL